MRKWRSPEVLADEKWAVNHEIVDQYINKFKFSS